MEFYFRKGLAPATQRAYSSSQKRYLEFCGKHRFVPLPLNEHQICQFVSWLGDQGLASSTLRSYLSALRNLQIANDMPDPGISNMMKLEQVLRGIKKRRAVTCPKNERLPITPELLGKLRQVWEQDNRNYDNIMLWAVSSVCFFGFFHSGELTVPLENAFDPQVHLTFSDIEIDNPATPTIMKIHLKASKTDPCRKGVDVFVGRTCDRLCPISAMMAYLAVRGNAGGFLFKFKDGKLLTKSRFIARCKRSSHASWDTSQRIRRSQLPDRGGDNSSCPRT